MGFFDSLEKGVRGVAKSLGSQLGMSYPNEICCIKYKCYYCGAIRYFPAEAPDTKWAKVDPKCTSNNGEHTFRRM